MILDKNPLKVDPDGDQGHQGRRDDQGRQDDLHGELAGERDESFEGSGLGRRGVGRRRGKPARVARPAVARTAARRRPRRSRRRRSGWRAGQYLVHHVADCIGCHSDFHDDRFAIPIKAGHGGAGRISVRQEARRAGRRAGAEHHAGPGDRPRRLDRRRDHARDARGRRPQGQGALPDDAVRVLSRDERRGRALDRRLPADAQADPSRDRAAAARLSGEPAHQVRAASP